MRVGEVHGAKHARRGSSTPIRAVMHKAVRPVRFTGPTADWFNIPLLRWLGGMDVELDTLRALAVAAGSPTDAVVVFLRPNA